MPVVLVTGPGTSRSPNTHEGGQCFAFSALITQPVVKESVRANRSMSFQVRLGIGQLNDCYPVQRLDSG